MWTSLECTYASRTALSWAHASKWSLPFVVSSRLTCYGLLTVYPAWQVTMWKSTSDMASATTHPKFGDVRANASQCTPAFSCFVSRGSARPPARGLPHSQFMGSVVQHFAGPPEAETWKLGAAFFGSNGALSQRTHACRPRRRAPSTCDCMCACMGRAHETLRTCLADESTTLQGVASPPLHIEAAPRTEARGSAASSIRRLPTGSAALNGLFPPRRPPMKRMSV